MQREEVRELRYVGPQPSETLNDSVELQVHEEIPAPILLL